MPEMMLCHKPENPASTTITLKRVLWSFSRHSLYGVCAGGPNQSCFWLWALVYSYVLCPSGNVYRYGRNMVLKLCSTRTASKKHFQYVARLPLTVLTILDAFMAREQPLLMHVINLSATAPVGYQPRKAAISHPAISHPATRRLWVGAASGAWLAYQHPRCFHRTRI
jgi:hypothetical protein